ncbi:MAG: hypothetical protein IJS08_10670, partial [Victivallales bacterium]|nr:hypothetical protein [Victivallales bacterium]
KNKRYVLVGTIAAIMSGIMMLMYVIPGTSCTLVWQEWAIVGGWAVLGLVFFVWSRNKYKDRFASLEVVFDTDGEDMSENK